MKALFLVALVPTVAAAETKPGVILDDLAATRMFEQVAISPDGQRVPWVEKVVEKGRDTGGAAVFAASIDGRRPAAKLGEGRHIAWSHDSARLAYVDKQVYVATFGGGARKLTNPVGYVTEPAWSPDD